MLCGKNKSDMTNERPIKFKMNNIHTNAHTSTCTCTHACVCVHMWKDTPGTIVYP